MLCLVKGGDYYKPEMSMGDVLRVGTRKKMKQSDRLALGFSLLRLLSSTKEITEALGLEGHPTEEKVPKNNK